MTSTDLLHADLDIDRLNIRCVKYICIDMYKALHAIHPQKLQGYVKLLGSVSTRTPRQSTAYSLYINMPRLELVKR